MYFYRLLLTANLLILLGGFSLNSQAAEATIKVASIAEMDVEVIKNGIRQIKRGAPDKAVPGSEVIFTNRFENVSNKTASDIVIDNPIPSNTEYKAGSAFGKDCAILFSADGGKTFGVAQSIKFKAADGREYNALPGQYTNIRWTYTGKLLPGKTGEVGFRAAIK
ncbi:MAG: hypothetical protein WC216_05540 [Gallionella sp.]|jgi:uncharacterized repeat protein (TIGR01451 family)